MYIPELFAVFLDPLWVDVDHNALTSKLQSCLANEIRALDRHRVNRNLVTTRIQQSSDIVDSSDPSPDSQRHKDLFGSSRHNAQNDIALFVAGGDVQKHQFIRPLLLVLTSNLDGIAGILQIDKIDPLDDSTCMNVKTGNDAFCQH